MTSRYYLAPALAGAAIVAAWLADLAAKRVRPGGERGDFWVRVTGQTALIGVAMAISAMAQSFPPWWRTGMHPYLDLVLEYRWAFPVALCIPFVAWGSILIAASCAPPRPREHSNWLAGSVGYTGSRAWLLFCAVPLIIPLLWVGRSRLDVGAESYPAAMWGTLAVLLISLCFLSLSTGKPLASARSESSATGERELAPPLKPWPAAMAEEGIDMEKIAGFSPSAGRRKVSRNALELERRLDFIGGHDLAPEVIETVNDLLSPPATGLNRPIYRLLFAPDNSGQIETVAIAACDLALMYRECTLIVTRRADPLFTRRLRRWVQAVSSDGPSQTEIVSLGADTDLPQSPAIWIVDAATLSDEFLGRLSDRSFAARIGMIVWWDIHEYTGVLAANLWAISRRLHRLILAKGRPDVRILVLVRDAFHAGAHMPAFVRRLLPYPFPPEAEVHVDRQAVREVQVHLLRGQQGFFERTGRNSIPIRGRHPELVAALASVSQGWPTTLEAQSHIPESELKELVSKWVGTVSMREALHDDPSDSGARIRRLEESEALALREIVCQGGRATSASLPHHVGLTLPDNPYVGWVIGRLGKGKEVKSSRRLVGPEGHPALFRRHLLLALSEQADTETGLMETLLWQEQVVERTLNEIAAQGKLSRQRVAFISNGERKREYLYKSTLGREGEKHPLDVVSDSTRLIRPATEEIQPLRVDEARLPIRAYTGRIFVENGIRYRIRDWSREQRGWIECQRIEDPARTWRKRTSQVKRIRRKGEVRTTSDFGLLTKYYPVSLKYQEDVIGYIRRDYDFTQGEHTDRPHTIPALLTEFDTSGFVMDFAPAPDSGAIYALCQGLRHVVPVHLGVDEDDVEFVPLEGEYMDKRQVFGLVIVDLYPQGMGLVEAICDDPAWTTEILKLTRDWLADICASNDGQAAAFYSPMARAATGGGEDPHAALELLCRIVGPEAKPASARAGRAG